MLLSLNDQICIHIIYVIPGCIFVSQIEKNNTRESFFRVDCMTQPSSIHGIENKKKRTRETKRAEKNEGIKAEYANRLRLWWACEEQNATAADESHEV